MTDTVLPAGATVSGAAARQFREHAREAYPDECCGILVGRGGERCEVLEAHPANNLNTERAHDRYLLDPRDFLRVTWSAESRGLEVVGFYHSHPDHPAQPSETDRAAAWVPYVYLIQSVVQGEPADARAWVLQGDGGQFAEIDWAESE
ncbi:MAG: M67 family metallopeptidase [Candidatus Dormibacteria bacterium]